MKRIFLILSLLAVSSFTFAGDLNPPSAPGSTMKTLGEVEPRIPLGQADFPVTINQSGSYYLTENVTLASVAYAFHITADNVSIDLMGFTVKGDSSCSDGVYIDGQKNINISNGTFDGFSYSGIYCWENNSQNINVRNVTIKNCAGSGIKLVGDESCVENCRIIDCGTGGSLVRGIYVVSQSRVANCLIKNFGSNSTGNGPEYAIGCYKSSHIIGNIIDGNFESSSANYLYMILCSDGCIVKNNTITQNGVSANCKRFWGISASKGVTCVGNNVSENAYQLSATGYSYGIYASDGCMLKENTVYRNFYNSSTVSTYGMYATGNCLVDSNAIYSNTGTNLYTSSDCVLGTNLAP